MKKEIFNILFLSVITLVVAWLYWPHTDTTGQDSSISKKSYILALTWQPAFCESKPNKTECRSQRKGRYDAKNFSLHGLWPQPRNNVYCNVSHSIIDKDKRGRWNQLPKLDIEDRIRNELSRRMPGYRSNLHRHEWYKHGTCMADDPQRYYELSMAMIDRINKTKIRDLFAQNIGKEITATQIVQAMERSFGKGARKRIKIICKRDGRRTLITGLHISMGHETGLGEISTNNDYILKAPKVPIGCKRGVIDPVSLQ